MKDKLIKSVTAIEKVLRKTSLGDNANTIIDLVDAKIALMNYNQSEQQIYLRELNKKINKVIQESGTHISAEDLADMELRLRTLERKFQSTSELTFTRRKLAQIMKNMAGNKEKN